MGFLVEDSILDLNFTNSTFQSSEILKIDGKDMYQVQLKDFLNELKMVRLEITNELGTVVCGEFEIGSISNSALLIITIVPVLLILLLLICILCILAKKKKKYFFDPDHKLYINVEDKISKIPLIDEDQKKNAEDKTDDSPNKSVKNGSVKSDSVIYEDEYKKPVKSTTQQTFLETENEKSKDENTIEMEPLIEPEEPKIESNENEPLISQDESDSKNDLKPTEDKSEEP